MSTFFEDKVVLVTGAGKGIGLATARAFAEAGASVMLADWDEQALSLAAESLSSNGLKAAAVNCDVGDEKQVRSLIEKTVEKFKRLDIAVNNAGIHQTPHVLTAAMDGELFDRIIRVNLRGVWNCMKYEIPQLLAVKGGAIVNVSSIGGVMGSAGEAAYIASKHGIVGLTKTAALEYARQGVRVNAVCPGAIRTPMGQTLLASEPNLEDALLGAIPMGRMGEAAEIAEAILWLSGPGASYVSGHTLLVDGGIRN